MMNNRDNRHMVDVLFIAALLFLFVFSVLTLIALGADVYRRNVDIMSDNSGSRVSTAYITEKLRQADVSGGIRLSTLNALPAIQLYDTDSSVPTITWLYVYQDALYELTTLADAHTIPSAAGQRITDLADMEAFYVRPGLLSFTLTRTDGTEIQLYLTCRSDAPVTAEGSK
ncbi:MAG: DUF4860 domain-containing protein [Butyrivibrio sp.]|nr:DUF4860 domain-containing protein [Butyrivibrio sp.]